MALTDLLAASSHGIPLAGLFAVKGGYYEATLTGGITLDATYPMWLGLDPDGAKTVVLDGISTAINDPAIHGLMRVIFNRASGAEAITVNDATAVTIGTVSQSEAGVFYHDEDSGWTLVAILTIALT